MFHSENCWLHVNVSLLQSVGIQMVMLNCTYVTHLSSEVVRFMLWNRLCFTARWHHSHFEKRSVVFSSFTVPWHIALWNEKAVTHLQMGKRTLNVCSVFLHNLKHRLTFTQFIYWDIKYQWGGKVMWALRIISKLVNEIWLIFVGLVNIWSLSKIPVSHEMLHGIN